ncbi:MAG: DegQ family serine endoprotease [Variibacter sp.]|nr:DegQ family serine endoprotease [Variibacter sp.]
MRPIALVLLTALSLLLTPGSDLSAQQQRRAPASPAEMRLSFAAAVKTAAPSVVNVYAARVVANRNPLMDDPFFRRFFGGSSMPRERVERSLGSGVIVDAGGLIVTNNHVIEGATEVKVALPDRREFEADIVLKDARTDLAVLRLKGGRESFPAIDLGNADDLQVGDLVLAIGNPFAVGQTVTHGIVSALARTQVGISDYQFFIQTDAAINPGNSGGALIDSNGRLVGINTAIFSRSGGSQGIGFAIPVTMVQVVVASAKGGSATVRRPWLGARLQAVTAEIADSMGLRRPSGALVASVVPNGPAARAGLRTGDLIVSIDGQAVDDPEAFGFRFATKMLGGHAQVVVLRAGQQVRASVPLEAAPENPPRDSVTIHGRSPFAGATVVNLSPAVTEEMRIDSNIQGVIIVQVEDGSAAQAVGFQPGDIILEVNGEKIGRTRELERVTQSPQRLWRLQISRGGQIVSTVLGG